MDTVTMTELKQVLKEQEDHIGQLEACNGDLRLGRHHVEKRLKGVREELEEAQKNLQGLENEIAHNAEVLKEKKEMLEVHKKLIQNLSRKLEAKEEVTARSQPLKVAATWIQ
ncbi:uncharacterized protein LOC124453949 isoform X1 [Xenia sp. Carnegie-2017]|uniref:uncharacterized protein LOC124453949 isoform X1 n=1 Tax=Xenia sp. Carnegie-2017 TaxID=2897299 RepID=UPI001F03E6D9|nr:uncharacterized protein LOC124453949 isoform X1 [Xenia sp. Carnegie-2017]